MADDKKAGDEKPAGDTPPAPPAPKPTETKLVSKISVGTMGCDASLAKRESRRIPLARVMGIARGIVQKVAQDGGPVYGLTGQFEGTNVQTGQVYQSGVIYLPPGVHEMVLEPLDKAIADGDKAASITFALDIFSVPAANKAGYTYESADLAAAKRVDPLADLKAAIENKPLPKLEAPKPAA